jgi:flagellar FliL protein
MSDTDELNLDDGDTGAIDTGGSKKPSGLAALLPNLLKFVAIGLGALIFIITVSVITYNILNKGGASQTVVPENSPYTGSRPLYASFTAIDSIRTGTKDPTPYSVVVKIIFQYDLNDNATATELTGRIYELTDFIRTFFRSKMAAELQPENEARLKQEIIELINTRVLSTAKIRNIQFTQLDVMEM